MKKVLAFCAILLFAACGKSEQPGTAPGEQGETAEKSNTQQPQVEIISPKQRATVPANQPIDLKYKVTPSPEGNHVHIYVDEGGPNIVMNLGGTYTISALQPGRHTIKVEEVTSEHKPTGNAATVKVTAQ